MFRETMLGITNIYQHTSVSQEREKREIMAAARKPPRNKRLKIALLDSVTHELRTPLTSIKASVTALLINSEMPRPQRNELLIVINEEADRLNKLVGEAVKVTQSSGPVKLNLASHAIEAIIDAAKSDCRRLLGQRSLSVLLPAGLPPVRADLNLAKKALVQLVENAAKYSARHEPIVITAELIGRYVATSVVDRGGGIDKSERCLIFAKSYRGKRHRHVVHGTGMGLSIANMIVRAHGGSLRVANQRGRGCVFSFTLPADPRQQI
jgi:two-component system sensor histidine kinase KdpD